MSVSWVLNVQENVEREKEQHKNVGNNTVFTQTVPKQSTNITNELDVVSNVIDDAGDRERLYQLWEKGQWSAKAIDLKQDHVDWHEKLNDEQRLAILVITAMFLEGEQTVVTDLTPFFHATIEPEDRIFLSTQIADEGRHHVFFDRFLREVVETGHDMVSTLNQAQPHLSTSYKQLFRELDRVTNQLSIHSHDVQVLTEALMLYHFVGEGVAHMGQHFLGNFGTKTNLLPGFMQGIKFIERDESRHIAFGLLWLQRLIKTNSKCKLRAIQTLNRVLPWVASVLFLPNFVHSLGVSHREACIFILRTLETRLKFIGISPRETQLSFLGHDASPEEKADAILILMEAGVFASNVPLHITEAAMNIVFNSVYNIALQVQEKRKNFEVTIQWVFADAELRYLKIGQDSGVYMGAGTIAKPQLTLHMNANDWIRIMLGELSFLRAFLTRRLRIYGNWMLLLRLLLIQRT